VKVLVLGSGAKEHALAWAMSKSHVLTGLFVAPGNSGTAEIAENIDNVDIEKPEQVVELCKKLNVDYCLAGYLPALNSGVVDALQDAGIAVFGAPKKTARLETDRLYAREFMRKYRIPATKSEVFEDHKKFEDYIQNNEGRMVVKRNHPLSSLNVFDSACKEKLLDFGSKIIADEPLLVEGFEAGYNLSIFVLVDGTNYIILPSVSDYHKACDNDAGAITNGMGAICPVPVLKEDTYATIRTTIIEPALEGLRREKLCYKGIFFFSLLMTETDAKVTSMHVRFGDPEAQVLLPLLESDFGNMLKALEEGTIDTFPLKFSSNSAVGVVIAGEGYPQIQPKSQPVEITSLYPERTNLLFHGATRRNSDGRIYTHGGRCFTVVGIGNNIVKANSHAYKGIERVKFKGAWNRNDIGNRFFEE
jgi:phosphoribosylamine--glycine ligase